MNLYKLSAVVIVASGYLWIAGMAYAWLRRNRVSQGYALAGALAFPLTAAFLLGVVSFGCATAELEPPPAVALTSGSYAVHWDCEQHCENFPPKYRNIAHVDLGNNVVAFQRRMQGVDLSESPLSIPVDSTFGCAHGVSEWHGAVVDVIVCAALAGGVWGVMRYLGYPGRPGVARYWSFSGSQ